MAYNNDLECKCMTAEKLMQILASIPSATLVVPNSVGNLLLVEVGDDTDRSIGYVDFMEEDIELFD